MLNGDAHHSLVGWAAHMAVAELSKTAAS